MEKLADWIKRAPLFIGLAAFAWLSETGNDGGFVKDIWMAAKTASPLAAMVALYLLYDERRERREAQRQCNDRTIDFVQSTNLQANSSGRTAEAVRDMAEALGTLGDSIGLPKRRVKRRTGGG